MLNKGCLFLWLLPKLPSLLQRAVTVVHLGLNLLVCMQQPEADKKIWPCLLFKTYFLLLLEYRPLSMMVSEAPCYLTSVPFSGIFIPLPKPVTD